MRNDVYYWNGYTYDDLVEQDNYFNFGGRKDKYYINRFFNFDIDYYLF